MKRLIVSLVVVLFLFYSPSLKANDNQIVLKDETSHLLLFPGKDMRIVFYNKLDMNHTLEMIFDLSKKNKIRDYLEWKKKGVLTKTVQKARIEIIESQEGKRKKKIKKVKDKKLRMAYLEAFRRIRYPDGMFFYLLSNKGKVVEIQGLDDYLSVLYATMGGSLPDLTFVRNQINLFALRDLLGIDNESSKVLAAKLHLAHPFFLTLDDALSGIKLATELYNYATRDRRAFKLLEFAPTDYDKCLLFLTDPGAGALKDSKKGFMAAWNACKAVPEPSVQVAKAMGRGLFLNVPLKVLTKEDFDQARTILEKCMNDARSLAEKKRMKFYLAATKALIKTAR